MYRRPFGPISLADGHEQQRLRLCEHHPIQPAADEVPLVVREGCLQLRLRPSRALHAAHAFHFRKSRVQSRSAVHHEVVALVDLPAKRAEAETAQRAADTALAESREQLVRAEGARDFATESRRVVQEQIAEKLDCTPDGLNAVADIEDASSLPDTDVLEDRVQRLIRERDNIGPVNLRAETEMEEVAARIISIEAEQEDLVAAIDKLRSAISRLNRQGREQLLSSFAAVNNHFKDLFKVLFGGGTAELQLTESDDPLEAGLEILAQPPGKRLQSLSLLSGGEQALTALAIIFAVFLTNPAPICVLDEVDAPLDDTNVARFCDLLRDIAGKTDTRFLVVTHHRMTMARMDRLFGVTMEQRGISKLVSVDLQTAERIRDAAVA